MQNGGSRFWIPPGVWVKEEGFSLQIAPASGGEEPQAYNPRTHGPKVLWMKAASDALHMCYLLAIASREKMLKSNILCVQHLQPVKYYKDVLGMPGSGSRERSIRDIAAGPMMPIEVDAGVEVFPLQLQVQDICPPHRVRGKQQDQGRLAIAGAEPGPSRTA